MKTLQERIEEQIAETHKGDRRLQEIHSQIASHQRSLAEYEAGQLQIPI